MTLLTFKCWETTTIQKSNLVPLTFEMSEHTLKLMHWGNNYKSLVYAWTTLPTKGGDIKDK